MSDNVAVVLFVALLSIALVFFSRLSKKIPVAPFPPGPKGLPFLGNIADLPQSQPWMTYAKWGKIYGGIVHVTAPGKHIVILNDAKYAIEMLEKKGRLYSDRPTLVMGGELVGWNESVALISFNKTWNEYRRMFSQFMGTRSKIEPYEDIFQYESGCFLKAVLRSPTTWVQHVRKFAGALVLSLVYGYKAKDEHDLLVKVVDDALDQFSEVTVGNAFLVDVFPILRYVPQWFPGAGWKKKVPIYRKTLRDMLDVPYDWVKVQMANGTAKPSFVSAQLDNRQLTPEETYLTKWGAAAIYGGGADTVWTVAAIESFFLAMTRHPAAQQKAQAEIDKVIGLDRLPVFADRESLPYVEAFFLEVFRMYPMAPLALPHVVREDDVHDGYFIPKGSIVIANVWQFFRDSNTYAKPEIFSPERFIATEKHIPEKDPRDYIFGFGRRICPGIHFADASMWLLCVSVLASLDVRPPVQDGKPDIPSGKYMEGTISHPETFKCVIKPRSAAAEALIYSL